MKNFLSGFLYALNGIATAFKEQRNLRIHFICALAVIATGLYLKISTFEWIIVCIMITLVLSLEMVNTAIENLVNLVTLERKPLAGKIKDIAAGAVLIAAIAAIVVAFLIFAKY